MTGWRQRAAAEHGTVLVLALVLVVVWSVVVLALAQFGLVGYELAAGSHERTTRIHASDSAVDTVVAALAADPDSTDCTTSNLRFSGVDVVVDCTLYAMLDQRVVDLEASIGGSPHLRARVRLDDTSAPADVTVTNWTVLR